MKKYVYSFLLIISLCKCSYFSDRKSIETRLNDYFLKKTDGSLSFELSENGLVSVLERKNKICTNKYIFDVSDVQFVDNENEDKATGGKSLSDYFDNLDKEAEETKMLESVIFKNDDDIWALIAVKNVKNSFTYIECYSNLAQNSPKQVKCLYLDVAISDTQKIYNELMKYKETLK
jgi:hypothetical protein